MRQTSRIKEVDTNISKAMNKDIFRWTDQNKHTDKSKHSDTAPTIAREYILYSAGNTETENGDSKRSRQRDD